MMQRRGWKRKLTVEAALGLIVSIFSLHAAWAEQRYSVTGLVLSVDKSHQSMVVSCQAIPNYMEAMVMSFPVSDAKAFDTLARGAMIDFTLVVDKEDAHATDVHIREFKSVEQDPLTAKRLALMNGAIDPALSKEKILAVGQPVPDFKLTDQSKQPIQLSQFGGKVVAISFMYTRCPFPNYCFRLSNNFGRLQKRFPQEVGRDLILMSITFDPAHDGPDELAKYGSIWHADPKAWHLLTGPPRDVQKISHMFGMDYWLDEGLMIHALHTIIIDRRGNLAANLEGNEFTADQLGDLVQTMLKP